MMIPWQLPIKQFSHYGFVYMSLEVDENGQFARYHPGIDYNGPGVGNADLGMPVLSVEYGQVAFIHDRTRGRGLLRGFGTLIGIKYRDPMFPSKFVTVRYAHCRRINPSLRVGSVVQRGEQIAELGKESGSDFLGRPFHKNMTAHLHLDILDFGLPVADYSSVPYLHLVYPDREWSESRVLALFIDPEEFIKIE